MVAFILCKTALHPMRDSALTIMRSFSDWNALHVYARSQRALVVIGNEILSGKVQDSNAYFTARELRASASS